MLTVIPFNQGSKQDVNALVDCIYSPSTLIWTTFSPSLPFPKWVQINGLDNKSELVHHVMLVYVRVCTCNKYFTEALFDIAHPGDRDDEERETANVPLMKTVSLSTSYCLKSRHP